MAKITVTLEQEEWETALDAIDHRSVSLWNAQVAQEDEGMRANTRARFDENDDVWTKIREQVPE